MRKFRIYEYRVESLFAMKAELPLDDKQKKARTEDVVRLDYKFTPVSSAKAVAMMRTNFAGERILSVTGTYFGNVDDARMFFDEEPIGDREKMSLKQMASGYFASDLVAGKPDVFSVNDDDIT